MKNLPKPQWRETSPRIVAPSIVYKSQGHVRTMLSDGTPSATYGPFGGLFTPIAVARRSGVLFTSVCSTEKAAIGIVAEASGIVAIDLKSNDVHDLVQPRENEHFVWLLALSPDETSLLAYSSLQLADRWDQPSLTTIDLATRSSSAVPVPKDAFYPLAVAFDQRLVLFSNGADVVLVDFAGEIRIRATAPDGANVECGDYNPLTHQFFFSSGSTYLLDTTGRVTLRARNARIARHVPNRDSIVFKRHDHDLWLQDNNAAKPVLIVDKHGLDAPDCYGWPPVVSPDGHFVLATLSWGRAPTEDERAQTEAFIAHMIATGRTNYLADPELTYEHHFCIVDLDAGDYWFLPDHSDSFSWL